MNHQIIEEGPLRKIYQESTYKWPLYQAYSRCGRISILMQKWPDLPINNACSQKFPTTDSNWRGMFDLNVYGHDVYLNLYLNVDKLIHIKHTLLLLNDEDIVVEQKHGENIFERKKKDEFQRVSTLMVEKHILLNGAKDLNLMVIIQENISEIPKTILKKNQSEIIQKINFCEKQQTKTTIFCNELKKINTNEVLKNDLKLMFENKEFSDFVIKLKDSSEIPVHKNILAARSSVFLAMFKNDSSEKNEGYVNITDIEKDIMILFLNFIYTGNIISDLTAEQARKLCSAADKYNIQDLKYLCGKYLEGHLEISNAMDILLFAELRNVSELKTSTLEFILNHKECFPDPALFTEVAKKCPNLLIELITKIFRGET